MGGVLFRRESVPIDTGSSNSSQPLPLGTGSRWSARAGSAGGVECSSCGTGVSGAAAAAHFDREMPDRQQAAEVPESATYCTIVRDSGEPFATADAMADRRLDRHPAREEVRTYCGIPLMGSDGAVMGTLCHYDLVPRHPEQINVELMLMVGSFLALNGHVPPYPHDRSPAEAPA